MFKNIFTLFITLIILVFLTLSCDVTDEENSAPEIESLLANPPSILINETTTLVCAATDEDNDDLTFLWSSDNGTFPNGNSTSSVAWKAPEIEGTYKTKVTVSDGDKSDSDEISIAVSKSNVVISGNPCSGISSLTHEGKTYHTVEIGNQCWLKENLDVGNMITVNDNTDNQTNNGVIEKFCYNNDTDNCDEYGGLYQWDEAMQYSDSEGAQGICPNGWHIPSAGEYLELSDELNGNSNALKAVGQGSGSGTGTNESGFSALIAGKYDPTWSFLGLSNGAFYAWTSTVLNTNDLPTNLFIEEYHDNIYSRSNRKSTGFSIRCIKD